jgi:hypothetical protein
VTYFKLLGIAVVAVLAITIAALIVIAGSGDDSGDGGSGEGPTPAASPSATGYTGPTQQPSTPAATAGGTETSLDVPADGSTVQLVAGSYRTARFRPQAHFALGEGWSAALDTERLVHLFRGQDPASNCVCFINPDGVIRENGAGAEALPGGGSVDGMIDWLTGDGRLVTSNPSSLQVGNLSGRQLTVEAAPGQAEAEYLSAGGQRFRVVAGERQHLTVLASGGGVLIIAQRSPEAEYTQYFGFAEEVVGGLTFTG